jgi:chromosome segregation ATPase
LLSSLSKKQRFEELAKELAKWDRERADVVARSTKLKNSAESLQLELDVTQKLADEHRIQAKLTQEREAIETRRADVEKRLSVLQDERRVKGEELPAIERDQAATSNEVADALAAKDQASASHELAMRSSRRAAQLADLRDKLISLVDPDESHCPLCGAEYGTHDRLREHLLRSARTSDIDDHLRDASSALGAAEIKLLQVAAREKLQLAAAEERRIALQQLDRDLAQLKAQHDSLTLSLRELGEPADLKPSSDVLTKVNELRANVEAADRSLSQLEDYLRSVENKRSRVSSELELLKSGEGVTLPPDVTVETITEAQQRVSRARKSVDERDQGLRLLRDAMATLESHLSDTRSQIAATEGRLNAERERKQRVLENFDRQCESVGLFGVNAQTISGELQQRAERLRSEIVEIRRAIGQANAIERRQIVNESMIKQRDLQKRLAEVKENLSVLRRAQKRFHLIAEELRTRSRTEADSAGALHLAAAQECVNDLYPHRHLNEVDIDFAEGELLVKDRWLKKGVRPQDYSSTGQANVLALSVFLGLALRQTFSSGRFLLLDEPVQNLDDLHFLAFLTLLKRVALSRQVIISTADSNVAEVMRRQLRSWSARDRRWCEYEWVAFQPESGPTIRRHEWPGSSYTQRLTRGPETAFEEIAPR